MHAAIKYLILSDESFWLLIQGAAGLILTARGAEFVNSFMPHKLKNTYRVI